MEGQCGNSVYKNQKIPKTWNYSIRRGYSSFIRTGKSEISSRDSRILVFIQSSVETLSNSTWWGNPQGYWIIFMKLFNSSFICLRHIHQAGFTSQITVRRSILCDPMLRSVHDISVQTCIGHIREAEDFESVGSLIGILGVLKNARKENFENRRTPEKLGIKS